MFKGFFSSGQTSDQPDPIFAALDEILGDPVSDVKRWRRQAEEGASRHQAEIDRIRARSA